MKYSVKNLISTLSITFLLSLTPPLLSDDSPKLEFIKKGLKHQDKYKKALENTTWIVPPETLLAYEYLSGTSLPVTDQTVWVINSYDKGYFFGYAYASINGAPSSEKKLVGSVTPFGDVYITFFPLSGTSVSTDLITGVGKFKKKGCKYYFVMQMNSAQNNLEGLAHWSYMISVKPDDYFYQHLPGVGLSVPDFIAEF